MAQVNVGAQPNVNLQDSRWIPAGEPTAWINPLCSDPFVDCPTCPLGFFCPCVLYGKTQTRLHMVHMGEDALDETKFTWCNAFCWIHAFMGCVGFAGIPNCSGVCTFTQHSRIRETYTIKGGWKMDLAKAFCCNQCALMQADREVKSRVAADEKRAENGIFAAPYDTTNQRMRYVPKDALFGNRFDPTTEASGSAPKSGPNANQSPGNGPGLDGAYELRDMDPNKVPRQDAQPIESDIASHEETNPGKVENVPLDSPPQATREANIPEITVSEFREAVEKDEARIVAQMEAHDSQATSESEHTIINRKEQSQSKDANTATTNGGADETVFVYYTPTTPQAQKLRDCVKTLTMSESTAGSQANSRRGNSSSSSSDSCSGAETLSFVEPSLRIMMQLQGAYGQAVNTFSTEEIKDVYRQSTPLSNIVESTAEECIPAQPEPTKHSVEGSEDTITNARYNSKPEDILKRLESFKSGPTNIEICKSEEILKRLESFKSPPTTIEIKDSKEESPTLHPKTRESVILPCTPLALEEVMEEIDLDGEWKVPQDGRFGALTMGCNFGRKMRPSFFDGNSEP